MKFEYFLINFLSLATVLALHSKVSSGKRLLLQHFHDKEEEELVICVYALGKQQLVHITYRLILDGGAGHTQVQLPILF